MLAYVYKGESSADSMMLGHQLKRKMGNGAGDSGVGTAKFEGACSHSTITVKSAKEDCTMAFCIIDGFVTRPTRLNDSAEI